MKTIKRIMLIALTIIISLSLAGQAEAKVKKTTKPTIRIVNGTVIAHQEKAKASQQVTYKFYVKDKGRWGVNDVRYSYPAGTERLYEEALRDGTYAVTSTVEGMLESDKVYFTVKNTIKHDFSNPFATVFFRSNVYTSYKLSLDNQAITNKKIVINGENVASVKNYKVALYYVDKKGKLKLVGKKKVTKIKSGNQSGYTVSFKPVKGQRDYAYAQINSKGKALGYIHFSYDPTLKKVHGGHYGMPTKQMKYKESDWK